MVIGDPPSDPAVKDTVSEPSPAVTEEMVGAAAVDDVEQLEVITRFPVPVEATATNNSCPAGPPQVTDLQKMSDADVREVQVMPSGLVITRFPVPVVATATNNFCPAGPPQVTDSQPLSAADVRGVQLMPSA